MAQTLQVTHGCIGPKCAQNEFRVCYTWKNNCDAAVVDVEAL